MKRSAASNSSIAKSKGNKKVATNEETPTPCTVANSEKKLTACVVVDDEETSTPCTITNNATVDPKPTSDDLSAKVTDEKEKETEQVDSARSSEVSEKTTDGSEPSAERIDPTRVPKPRDVMDIGIIATRLEIDTRCICRFAVNIEAFFQYPRLYERLVREREIMLPLDVASLTTLVDWSFNGLLGKLPKLFAFSKTREFVISTDPHALKTFEMRSLLLTVLSSTPRLDSTDECKGTKKVANDATVDPAPVSHDPIAKVTAEKEKETEQVELARSSEITKKTTNGSERVAEPVDVHHVPKPRGTVDIGVLSAQVGTDAFRKCRFSVNMRAFCQYPRLYQQLITRHEVVVILDIECLMNLAEWSFIGLIGKPPKLFYNNKTKECVMSMHPDSVSPFAEVTITPVPPASMALPLAPASTTSSPASLPAAPLATPIVYKPGFKPVLPLFCDFGRVTNERTRWLVIQMRTLIPGLASNQDSIFVPACYFIVDPSAPSHYRQTKFPQNFGTIIHWKQELYDLVKNIVAESSFVSTIMFSGPGDELVHIDCREHHIRVSVVFNALLSSSKGF